MRSFRFRRPRAGTTIAFVALMAALSGTAVALPGKSSVDSGDIKNKQVMKADLASDAVTSSKVKNSSLLASDFKSGELPSGPKGDPGAQGVKGAPGATKVIIRRGSAVTITVNNIEPVTVSCLPGEVATGGGVTLTNGLVNDLVIPVSIPLDSNGDGVPDGWDGRAANLDWDNNNMGTLVMRADVVCASP